MSYDNYIDYSESVKIEQITKPLAKAAIDAPHMADVISDDMRLYAVDILFKKK